jgi:putative transposase
MFAPQGRLAVQLSTQANAYVERLIGSIRRECLDHVIVLNKTGLRRILKSYFDYYERSRTHLSLGKDAPLARAIQPPWTGPIVAIPQVEGIRVKNLVLLGGDSFVPNPGSTRTK